MYHFLYDLKLNFLLIGGQGREGEHIYKRKEEVEGGRDKVERVDAWEMRRRKMERWERGGEGGRKGGKEEEK